MRTKRTIINLITSLGSSVVLLLLGLITRRLFITNFDSFIPGFSDTINSLFNFFSVAEFGVGSVISYRLYEQIAAKDVEQISRYMSLYKWAYRIIGVIIAVLAGICAFFLPALLAGQQADWSLAYGIYFLQVVSTLSGYFLVTRRLLYTCTQQGYICTRIDLLFNVLTSLARIAIAIYWPNYLLYFGVTIVFNTLANVVVALRYKHDFPAVHEVKVGIADFKQLGLFHDLRYYLVHRLSSTVYSSSDNLVVTRMQGAAQVTYMGNYASIIASVTSYANKIMDSFAAAIGSIVYDKDAQADGHAREVFWGLDLFSYLFGSFIAVAYFCLFQPFIALWVGKAWLLPMLFVFFLAVNQYIGWNHRMLGSYRAVLGRFEADQWYMIVAAIGNLILNIVLIVKMGLPGIMLSTAAAHCSIWIGRARVVFRYYMKGGGRHYLFVQLAHLATLLAEMFGCLYLCNLLPDTLLGLLGRCVIVCIVPNVINLACYIWTPDAAYLRGRAGAALAKLKKK